MLLLIVLVLVVFYFLPAETKIHQLERLADFVPESLQEKAENFLLTTAERREKIILNLETRLSVLERAVDPEAKEMVTQMQALLETLKKENDDLSFAEIAKEKLVEQFLKKTKETTPQTQ